MARMAEPWGRRDALWLLVRARAIWVSAVADEAAVHVNLRLLATLTALFSLPDLGQGLAVLAHAATAGAHAYGAYVAALGTMELVGAVLLARRSALGRRLIMAAAAGFYVEMALGLAGYERSVRAGGSLGPLVPVTPTRPCTPRREGGLTDRQGWRGRCSGLVSWRCPVPPQHDHGS
jgi:hypothetical protein